jgi:hypothetical protein
VANAIPRPAVQEDPGTGGAEKDGNPVSPALTEPELAEDLKKERPTHRIEGFGDVDLEK